MRKRYFAWIIAIAVAVILGATPISAHADDDLEGVTVPLTLDCTTVPQTAEAQSFIQENELCEYSAKDGTSSEPHQRSATAIGNCGTLTFVFQNFGSGRAFAGVTITTTTPILHGSYTGLWTNYSIGWNGLFWGSGYSSPFTSTWTHGQFITTGPGFTVGTIEASAVTVAGTCHGGPLSDSDTIT